MGGGGPTEAGPISGAKFAWNVGGRLESVVRRGITEPPHLIEDSAVGRFVVTDDMVNDELLLLTGRAVGEPVVG